MSEQPLNRHLVLMVDNKPVHWLLGFKEARSLILELGDADVDRMSLWRVYYAGALNPATDATEDFANDWRGDLAPVDPIPAFVRHHCKELREVAA